MARHLTREELEAGLDDIREPPKEGEYTDHSQS